MLLKLLDKIADQLRPAFPLDGEDLFNCPTDNRWYVSSVSSSGLKLTQISEPGLRMVGITVRQDFFETFCASSTHRMSAPSSDLML